MEKRWGKRLREYCRYLARTQYYRNQIKQITIFINQHPYWTNFFNQNLYRLNTLLSKYCDQRFDVNQRLQALQQNMLMTEKVFNPTLLNQLLIENQQICLVELSPELDLYLSVNHIDPYEGFLALNIQDKKGQHIYDASFTLLEPNKLLVASIQGPNSDNAQDLIKQATKQLQGARPMFLLVDAFRLVAQALGLELIGIAHKNQAKYRWNDRSKLLFNYDQFWQENRAELNGEGYWQLPLHIERKSLEDVPSKKRSMYRKRFEMYDQMAQQIEQHLAK